ncbi:uncharacterized protein LOC109544648 [Dendroctonus ponderosae]
MKLLYFQQLVFRTIFIFACYMDIVSANEECIPLNVLIIQKVENLGFHRDLNWFIETRDLNPDKWLNSSCNVTLKIDVGKGVFVNPDQADDLKRLGKLDILINGTVDVEVPAHEGKSYSVYIYLNRTEFLRSINVKLPIHLRYQRSLLGGHGHVTLSKPQLLVHCPGSNKIICGKNTKIMAPVSSEEPNNIKVWKNVLYYQGELGVMELEVPIGNLNDYSYVSVITCILGCAGCIYIISLMSAK